LPWNDTGSCAEALEHAISSAAAKIPIRFMLLALPFTRGFGAFPFFDMYFAI
jgi:hypothetical protein